MTNSVKETPLLTADYHLEHLSLVPVVRRWRMQFLSMKPAALPLHSAMLWFWSDLVGAARRLLCMPALQSWDLRFLSSTQGWVDGAARTFRVLLVISVATIWYLVVGQGAVLSGNLARQRQSSLSVHFSSQQLPQQGVQMGTQMLPYLPMVSR